MIKCAWFLRMTDTASEGLVGPDTVLSWPSVAMLWHPSKSQFQPGHETRERGLLGRHKRRDFCEAEGWTPPGS